MNPQPSRIAHYTVTAKLGEGGMGAVYRATDTKLNRDVAIKMLPDAFAGDPDYLGRFTREAQVLAALNHPNIAAVYGVEERAIVMELVEGSELPVGLAVAEALPIARQIAEALEAAHEKGIIHRDLKPANIKLTPDGVVKVLDFGLAKAIEINTPPSSANSPTLTLRATQAGVVLGTAAYMSPEQARGRPVDKRADIWAFGVVLYELLTGRQLFGGGDTITDTLASVVKDAPDLSVLPADTPANVRSLLERCLRKDPKTRLRDIGEARIALAEPVEAPAAVVAVPQARSTRLPWIIAAVATVLSAVAVVAWMRPRPDTNLLYRVTLPSPDGVEEAHSAGPQAALSPDGRQLAFIATSEQKEALWIRPVGTLAARRLERTEGAAFPFWSPDGKYVAFFTVDKLKKVSVDGGAPQVICDVKTSFRGVNGDGGTWRGDGMIVFPSGIPAQLHQVSAGGGTPTPLFPIDEAGGERAQLWPQALPDGRLLYLSMNRNQAESGIYVRQVGSDRGILVVKSAVRAVFAPPQSLLYVRDGAIIAQGVDPKTYQLTGDPVQLVDEVSANASNGRASFTVQGNVLLYQTGMWTSANLVWYDRQGRRTPVVAKQDRFIEVRLSPDGKTAALSVGAIGKADLWALDAVSASLTRVTQAGSISTILGPWSPDSRRVLISPLGAGQPKVEATLGARELRKVALPDCSVASDWLPTAGTVLCFGRQGVTAISEDGTGKPATLTSDSALAYPQVSPDGKRVAYMSAEAGRIQVWLASYPTFTDRRQVPSPEDSIYPQWRSDGRELFFSTPDSIMAADVRPGTATEIGTPRVLFKASMIRGLTRKFSAAPDGSRFLVIEPVESSVTRGINAILNWPAALGR